MIEIDKIIDELNNPEYTITTDKGVFKISYGGDLDLYWRYVCDDYKKEEYTIDITKENYFLYNLIFEVYDSVISCAPTKYEELKVEDIYKRDWTNDLGAQRSREYLLNKDVITWISDDGFVNDGARVSIKKKEDKFELVFKRGYSDGRKTYGVRFRNSGSRYIPFNSAFGIMYNKLKYYDKDNYQIHIEEYIYKEKHKI